ncbi:multicopper oxidase family protein [Flindersiella endophytica]
MAFSRRRLLLSGAGLGLIGIAPQAVRRVAFAAPLPGGSLDPRTIPKYVTALPLPRPMPASGTTGGGSIDVYRIAVRQFTQQILPTGSPATAVWGYGSIDASGTFRAPARTIEATAGRPVRITWLNQLVDGSGRYRRHLLPVDPTLHWANPPGGATGRDSRPEFTSTPGAYTGPVPTVTHVHGAHTSDDSDGYPEAWYLPPARDIPSGYATVGSFYSRFRSTAEARTGAAWPAAGAVFQYPNDQRATTLWFHDHTLGMTRVNLHAGLHGLYLLRGGGGDLPAGVLPGPAPRAGDPAGTAYHEIPLVIQDKSFNSDGSQFFPAGRGFFGDVDPDGPFIPDSEIPPIWNPEYFGNTIVVNGRTWPTLTVEPRRYRFRVLNTCNTRVLLLKVAANPLAQRPVAAALPCWQIGSDGGFLPAPSQQATVRLAPAERADVIVDFTGVRQGTALYLVNEGPDEPFGGGEPGTDFDAADPGTTGQVMRFVVGTRTGADGSTPPGRLTLPSAPRLGAASRTRSLSLNELEDESIEAPTSGRLGTTNADGSPNPMMWGDELTENPAVGATELWELGNFTEDAHPIHVHLVQFEVVDRRSADGVVRGPDSWETGTKDTVVALPGETTRIKARFDLAGRYVWHCHIIDHEDNEMMRPYQVG